MKKFLLSILLLIGLSVIATAGTVEFDFKTNSYGLPAYNTTTPNSTKYVTNGSTITASPITITFSGTKTDAWRFWSDGLRAYNKKGSDGKSKEPVFTISASEGNISKIEWTTATGNTFVASTGNFAVDKTTATWTGDAASVTFNFTTFNNIVAISKLTITYNDNTGKAPAGLNFATQSFQVAEGGAFTAPEVENPNGLNVSYSSSAPEVATVDASTGAVTIVGIGETKITATSAETEKYNAGSASYTLKVLKKYANFNEIMAAGVGTEGVVTGPITVYYQNGQNLYAYDNDNEKKGMLFFGSAPAYTPGTTFSSVICTYVEYGNNKTPEFTNFTFEGQTEGTAPEPTPYNSPEELGTDIRYQYVELTDVDITAISGKNFAITVPGFELPGYNKFGIDVRDGKGFTVTGIVDVYNDAAQIYPVSITGGTLTEVVADPVFSINGGQVEYGSGLAISCSTEGAQIFYTTDDSTPNGSSTPYTGPLTLTSDCTVKAIAYKEGAIASQVVSQTYTVLPEGKFLATFDFTLNGNVKDLTENTGIEATSGSEHGNGDLTGVEFFNGPVALTISKGEGTAPRWFKDKDGKTELRFYRNNVMTIAVQENGYKIEQVEFPKEFGNSFNINAESFDPASGTYNDRVWTAGSEIVTKLNVTPTGTCNAGKVQVIYVEDPDAVTSAIENVAVDNSDAPVEYFNLQGVRVDADALVPGLYIVRRGTEVSKILVK